MVARPVSESSDSLGLIDVGAASAVSNISTVQRVHGCFALSLRPISINIHDGEKSLEIGLASFWIYPNPVSRTDAAVTKAPTVTPLSRIMITMANIVPQLETLAH